MRLAGLAALVASAAAVGLLGAASARAQLSPGPLSRAHAELEGSANCLSCHQAQKGVDASRCLDCHEALAERIEAGLGLHANDGYQRCELCHIEHHGRDFELVWWGEDGRDSFDHSLTGFLLAGAHARAGCDDCHRPGNMIDRARLEASGTNLERTFLGLDRACLSCHDDAHFGQFAADRCADCHGFESWTPPSGFDHDRTRFPLTGLHRGAACTACHETRESTVTGEPIGYLHFAVGGFASCADCHQDPHDGRLGARCESCHSTAGWARVDRGVFDHDRTRFALAGAHVRVECEACHRPGTGFRIERFETCTDCHRDEHLGQFVVAASDGCTACHTVDAFVPTTFTLADHQRTSFQLEGAHLAIPCIACHREVAAVEIREQFPALAPSAPGGPEILRQFRFAGTGCLDCHADPHGGELEATSCESCHELSSWRAVTFDHETTGLPLRGRHEELGCRECHAEAGETQGEESRILFGELSASCSTCHGDPHAGQFVDADGAVSCVRCHDESGWTELSFDHDRDARFPLEGEHRKLACAECHPSEGTGDGTFIRYRPLERTCEACHATESSRR